MDTVKNARRGQISPPFRDISTNIVAFRIFTLSAKINLFLLSPQIQFLCVSPVKFPHFQFLAPLSQCIFPTIFYGDFFCIMYNARKFVFWCRDATACEYEIAKMC